MQTTEEYDVVVLGSGEAGKYIAWTQAKKGMRSVVIERKYIGGSCPNIACLPSKNIIHSAKVASYFTSGAGELIGVVQVAMLGGLPYTVLRDAIFTHPTMPEGLIPLFSAVPPRK
jgi:pyruvate/2-oxoglutarate dehydrogenase complex dihydrolipoamide dehydrogenase (E3) component